MPGILFRGLNNLRDPFGLYTPQQPKTPEGARVEPASVNVPDAASAARPRIDGAAEPQKLVREQPGRDTGAAGQPAEAPKVTPPSDLRQYIIETAEDVGVDPLDLATAISYETMGTFDPTIKGPVTKYGQHKGLIQFGEDQARQYGIDWSRPVESQLGKGKAVAQYLRDNGVKPGMGLLDIYSAINAGEVGLHNRSDAKNGGAPGTVADKVANQMAGHREKAARLLGLDRPQLPEGKDAPTPAANPSWNEPERQFADSGMRNGALGIPGPTEIAYAPEAKNPAAKGLARLVRAPEQMDGFAGELKFVHKGQEDLDETFKSILTDTSAEIGQPLTIQSGYRSAKHPVEARKKKGPGEHSRRTAADINLRGKSNAERIELVKKLRKRGVNRFGTYSSMPDMLHVDMKDQTGTGDAWFMHDTTNRKIGNAPDWFKTAQSEVASIKPGSVPVSTRTAGAPRREGLPVRVDFDPKDPMGLYTDRENPLSGYGMPEGADAPIPTPRPEIEAAQGAPDMGGDEIDAIVGDLNAENPDRFAAMSPEEYLAWKKEFDAQHKSQGAGGDTDRLMRRGGAQMGLGIRELVRNIPGGETLLKGTDTISGWLIGEDIEAGDVDRKMGEISDRATATMTPAQRAASTKEWVTEKTGADGETSYALGPAWSDPRSYIGVLAESLPSTAATMGTSAILARGTYVAAQAAGVSAKQAAAKAATTALVSGSIGEAMISGGQTAAAVREKLAAIPREVLADSDAVRALTSQGMSEDEAISALSDDAAVKSMVISGVFTGAFGGRGDWFMAKVFTEGVEGTLGQRLRSGITKGMVAEGILEEMPQSMGEQFAQNVGVKEVDPDQRLMEGVPNAAAGGLVAGGIMGGGMGAAGSAVSPRGTGMADDAATPEPAPVEQPAPAQTQPAMVTDTFVVNAPADAARGIPAEDIHGVTVKQAPNQSGVAEGMMRVTLPSGEERIIGTALLNGQDAAQPGGVLKRAKTYADSRAPAPANDPGQADQGGGDPGAAGLAGAAGAASAVPAAAAAAPGPGMEGEQGAAGTASLPAVGSTVTVTDPGLDPFEARVESIEGDEALVFDPITGELYQVAISSIAGASVQPSRDEPAPADDAPMVAEAEPAAAGEVIPPEETAPATPALTEPASPAPDPLDTTQPTEAAPRKPVKANGKTVSFPDDAHRDMFDHGEKLALGRNSNLSAAKIQQVLRKDREALADKMGIPVERVDAMAGDYRRRALRAAREAGAERQEVSAPKMGRILDRFRAERNPTPLLDEAAHQAATSPTNTLVEPSLPQKEAGNYKLGHAKLGGLDFSIENPAGSERKGVDGDGKEWSVKMPAHYGYIRGTKGADGDHLDAYIKPGTSELDPNAPVFAVNQIDKDTGRFDEIKVIFGAATLREALEIYEAGFSDGKGRDRIGSVAEFSLSNFKGYLDDGGGKRAVEGNKRTTRVVSASSLPDVAQRDGPVSESEQPQLSQLRRAGDSNPPTTDEFSGVPRRGGGQANPEASVGSKRQREGIRARQPDLENKTGAGKQHAQEPLSDGVRQEADNNAVGERRGPGTVNDTLSAEPRDDTRGRNKDSQTGVGSDNAGNTGKDAENSDAQDKRTDGLDSRLGKTGKYEPKHSSAAPADGLEPSESDTNAGQKKASLTENTAATYPGLPDRKNLTSNPANTPALVRAAIGMTENADRKMWDLMQESPTDRQILDAFNELAGTMSMSFPRGSIDTRRDSATILRPGSDGNPERITVKGSSLVAAIRSAYSAEPPAASKSEKQAKSATDTQFADNKLFTADKVAAARARLKSKMSQLNSGIDPELLIDGMTIAGAYIESGVRKFGDYAARMVEDFGDGIKPYLLSFYEASRNYPGLDTEGMTSPEEAGRAYAALMTSEAADAKVDGVETSLDETRDGIPAELEGSGPRTLEGTPSGQNSATREERNAGKSARPSSGPDLFGEEPARGRRTGSGDRVSGSEAAVSVPTGGNTEARPVGSVKTPTTASNQPTEFAISEDDAIGEGGAKTKFRQNVEAIRLIRQLDDEGRAATRDEQKTLAKWVGWGGLQQSFYREDGSVAKGWEKQAAELKELLTPDEYDAAMSSTRNAHYTAPEVVKAMWKAVERMGFAGGRVLEPSVGSGNFLGLMLSGPRAGSAIVGAELDHITGSIAKNLYPKATIKAPMGFEKLTLPDDTFDLAIGNPPFGSERLYDPNRKAASKFSIHNFFFAKSIDTLKPGGVLAMVVSNFLLDSTSSAAREYLADRADLIGAIRLPNDAFLKNAGTEVTTDIVFLRKRAPGDPAGDRSWTETKTFTDKEGREMPLNRYFHDNPDMMLGDFGGYGTMYGRPDQPALISRPGEKLGAVLDSAIGKLPADIMRSTPVEPTRPEETAPKEAADALVNSAFLDGEGNVYVRLADHLGDPRSKPLEAPNEKALQRVKGLIRIRDAFTRLRRAQVSESATDEQVANLRERLNKTYDAFVKANGPINLDANNRVFSDDPTWPQLAALEDNFDRGISSTVAKNTGEKPRKPSAKKAAIFTKRTQQPYRRPTSAATAKDALAQVLADYNRVDMAQIRRLYPKPEAEIVAELGPLVYRMPDGSYDSAEAYLSGNVKKKLAEAIAAAADDPALGRNVAALQDVIPEDIEAVDINVKPGAPWIPANHMADFIDHITGNEGATATFSPMTAKWVTKAQTATEAAALEYSTDRVSVNQVLDAAINDRQMQVYDKHSDGSSTLNPTATEAANGKVQKVKDAWSAWIWDDDARRAELHRIYNDTYNTDRLREYDGSHLALPGKVSDDIISLRPHQKNFIWRGLQSSTVLADHTVGAGKTFAAIGLFMEWRRTGTANKPMLVVPNHLVGQWAADFVKLYPGAKVLAPTKADFAADNRKRLFARMATGDYDAIIVAHSTFGRIGVDPEFEAAFIRKQIADIELAESALREAEGKSSRNSKQLTKWRDNLKTKLEKLMDAGKKDEGLTFNEIGIDGLVVDECFTHDTLVETDRGPMKIGVIVENRLPVSVISRNSSTHAIEWKPVTNWYAHKRRSQTMVEVFHEHGSFICTPNHRVWVDGHGYKKACDLAPSDRLLAMRDFIHAHVDRPTRNTFASLLARMQEVGPNHYQEVRGLRGDVLVSLRWGQGKLSETVLQRLLQDEDTVGERSFQGKVALVDAGNLDELAFEGASEPRILAADEIGQPDEVPRHQGKGLDQVEGYRASTEEARRQWAGAPATAVGAGGENGADPGIRGLHAAHQGGDAASPEQLQDRSRLPSAPASSGDRWKEPQHGGGQVEGRQEGQGLAPSRMVGIALLKPDSDGEYRFGGRDHHVVYDIEVEGNHNYFANRVLVSNSHEFKNLAFATSMPRIAGLGNPTGSQKAADLFMKMNAVRERTGGRNLAFLTGTPISNTMAEMFTMQRYLDEDALSERGINHFDAWARVFGEVVTDFELSPAGKYTLKSRFSKFVNMPELIARYRSFADVISNDDIQAMLAAQGKRLPIPKVRGGKPENMVVGRSDDQADFIGVPISTDEQGNDTYPSHSLIYRAENLPKKAEKGGDNMLKIMSDARKAALDMRLIDPAYGDNPKSKTNRAADEMLRIYKKWNKDKGTQLVFIDLSTPKGAVAKEKARIEDLVRKAEDGDEAAQEALDKMSPDEIDAINADFDVYNDLKAKLIARGVPEAEIAFIHDANTDLQKETLFGKVRSGQVRFMFGSTAKMGAGTNVQDRLVGLHHLDAPWRPSDMEQREGRIIRQGNMLYARDPDGFEVEINRYATENTLDSRMYQTIEQKATFIGQVRKGASGDREINDIGGEAANAAEMKAAASGNPLILEEVELRKAIRTLDNRKREFTREQFRLQDRIRMMSEEREALVEEMPKAERDAENAPVALNAGGMTVDGEFYKKAGDAGGAMVDRLMEMWNSGARSIEVGQYGPFRISGALTDKSKQPILVVHGEKTRFVTIDDLPTQSGVGLGLKLRNTVNAMISRPREIGERMATIDDQLPKLKSRRVDAFPEADDLAAKVERHREVLDTLKPKPKAAAPKEGGAETAPADAQLQMNPWDDGFDWSSDQTKLTADQQQELAEIIKTVAGDGVDVRFVDKIEIPANHPGRAAWGETAPGTAAGMYMRGEPAIVLALDTATTGAAYHEAFHHVQRALLTDAERAILADKADRLRAIIRTNPFRANQVDRMAQTELEAEAFATWANAKAADRRNLALPAKIRTAWGKIKRMIERVRNALKGWGFKTVEDIFENAASGRTARRGTSGRGGGTSFQAAPPVFYSALTQAVSRASQKKGGAAQWMGIIRNTPGVKPEEIEWSGVSDWLKDQPGPVTREALVDYLRANETVIEETVLKPGSIDHAVRLWHDVSPEVWSDMSDDDKANFRTEYIEEADDDFRSAYEKSVDSGSSQYDSYTLAGGSHYRELLIKLPSSPEEYDTSHFPGERKVVAHVRFNERSRIGNDEAREQYERDRQAYDAAMSALRKKHFDVILKASFERDTLQAKDKAGIMARAKAGEMTWPQAARELDDIVGKQYQTPLQREYRDAMGEMAEVAPPSAPTTENKRILFIEEIQSDWHQAGRKNGYNSKTKKAEGDALEREVVAVLKDEANLSVDFSRDALYAISTDEDWQRRWGLTSMSADQVALINRYRDMVMNDLGGIPDAPFKTSWPELSFKRMIRWAAEHGYDEISWTPGEVQAERYDLSTRVDSIDFKRVDGSADQYEIAVFDKGFDRTPDEVAGPQSAQDLENLFGKDIAKKIVDGATGDFNTIEGEDLRIGGEGMIGFYDKILLAAVNKLVRKWGAKVGKSQIDVKDKKVDVWTVEMTDAMRDAAQAGLPMFQMNPKPQDMRPVPSPTRDGILDMISSKFTDLQPAMLALVPMNYFEELRRPNMTAIKEYLLVKRAMDAYRGDRHSEANEVAQKWLSVIGMGIGKGRNNPVAQDLADLMHRSTLAGVDPSKSEQEDHPAYAGLRSKYEALPKKAQALYREVRDSYAAQSTELDKILLDNVRKAFMIAEKRAEEAHQDEIERINKRVKDPVEAAALKKEADKAYNHAARRAHLSMKARMTKLRIMFESSRVPPPYFPLSRFGRYFVSVRDDMGELISFSKRESHREAKALADEMRQQFPTADIDMGVMGEKMRARDQMDPRLLSEIEGILGESALSSPEMMEVMDQIWQRYLDTMPDLSVRKRFIHRSGIAGFDRDALRAYSTHMFHAAHQMARLKYGMELTELTRDVGNQARRADKPVPAMNLANELKKRHEWVMNPTGSTAAQSVTSTAFVWYLGTTPAAAMVNLTQTVMMGIPVLGGRFGIGKAAAAIAKASADSVRGYGLPSKNPNLTDDEKKAMEIFYRSGLVDRTQSHDLAGVGDTGVRYSPVRQRMMGVVAWAFHNAERWNREVTALAAYRLARDASTKDEFTTQNMAIDAAHDLTWKTHFDYSNSSRPRFMQNDAMKVAMVFRAHNINMLYRMGRDIHQSLKGETKQARREARLQLAGIFGMQALMAGVTGIAGFNLAMAVLGMFLQDDDDPFDYEMRFRQGVTEALGPELGGIVLNGAPGHYTGLSLTNRIGMPDLWFRSPNRDLEGRDEFNYWVLNAAGASVSMLGDLYRGVTLVRDGETVKGVEAMAPKFVKDQIRAYRYATEGVTDFGGNEVLSVDQMDAMDIVSQSIGFSPAKVSERWDRNTALKNADSRIQKKRSRLLADYALAHKMGDDAMQQEVLGRIKRFNEYPLHRGKAITPKTIRQSLKQRQRLSAKRQDGVLIQNERVARDLRKQLPEPIY